MSVNDLLIAAGAIPVRTQEDETIERFEALNACGQPRTILIKRNEWGRYTWRLIYPDHPVADKEFTYTYNWFDDITRAKRSALRFMKTLGQ